MSNFCFESITEVRMEIHLLHTILVLFCIDIVMHRKWKTTTKTKTKKVEHAQVRIGIERKKKYLFFVFVTTDTIRLNALCSI